MLFCMPFQTEYFLGIIKSLHLLMLSLAAMNLINSIAYKSNEILKVKNSKQTDICQVHVIKSQGMRINSL